MKPFFVSKNCLTQANTKSRMMSTPDVLTKARVKKHIKFAGTTTAYLNPILRRHTTSYHFIGGDNEAAYLHKIARPSLIFTLFMSR